MKKIYFILLAVATMAVACEKGGKEPINNPKVDIPIDIVNVTCNNLEDLLKDCDEPVDGKAALEAISAQGVRFEKYFEYNNEMWHIPGDIPGEGLAEGFIIRDNIFCVYNYTSIGPEGEEPVFICSEYDCDYDEESATLMTKSKSHDYTYTAKIIYFKDDIIIIDGVLGCNDYMNGDYAERRYIYLCTIDSEALAEWEAKLEK